MTSKLDVGLPVEARSSIMRACVVLLLLAGPALAQNPEAEFVSRVNKSIELGKKFLIEVEGGTGHWDGLILENLAEMRGGQSALATLALLTAGMPVDDPVMVRSLENLRKVPPRTTYVVSLVTMALAEARQKKDLERIKSNAEWLLANAVRDGNNALRGWSYPRQGSNFTDGSNTQYALLGLYAAKQAGVKIAPNQWTAIRDLYTKSQKPAGFWTYDFLGKFGNFGGASFTMTSAGVCGLLIADMGLNTSQQQLDEATGIAAKCGIYDTNSAVDNGMKWLAQRFAFDDVPGLKTSMFYNVYGIERLGRLSGQRFIGKFDWYREGCEFLTRIQNDDGSWSRPNRLPDQMKTIATSFALLFLSKGRTPLLMTKFAFDTGLGEPANVVGWNRKQNDVRNLVDFASRELFNGLPMGWQVYDTKKVNIVGEQVKSEVESLLACPIIYLNGHTRPNLNGVQKEMLKRYVDEGGFLFAEACCGSEEFAREFRLLVRELFPENKLEPISPAHPLWRSFFNVSPADITGVEVLERGCKTVVVFSSKPLAGFWEENRFAISKGTPAKNLGERAYQFAGNVIAYATGLQPPEQRGTKVVIVGKDDATPPRGAFKPAQLKVNENHPAPAAMRNLMAHLQATTGLDAVLDKQSIAPADPELDKYKFIYLHGRKPLELKDAELTNLRTCLETGGLLFADSACGKPEFDKSFREMLTKLFPQEKLVAVPLDDELYSKKINGEPIAAVQRREKPPVVDEKGNAEEVKFQSLPPALEGIKIDGRWVVIYSKYDIGCALERHKSTDCLGHTPESALKLASAAVLYSLMR
jgi:Domain of unknown function (DUF4159)